MGLKDQNNGPQPINKETSKENFNLNREETELMLLTLKNGLFKGEYVEILYNLTLKLQNHLLSYKEQELLKLKN